MIQLFCHIKENKEGGFTYHEFKTGWSGYSPFSFGSVYKEFGNRAHAENYAKKRGACDAYTYRNY